jgi:hypothetical protein
MVEMSRLGIIFFLYKTFLTDKITTMVKVQKVKENNYAFIDSQNLNLGVRDQGWILSFQRFRVYLKEKYSIAKAFIFIGYLPGNESLYTSLQSYGYICMFKPTLELPNKKIKGNVDAELVLHTMIELNNFDRALVISGDGDFYCLIEYLIKLQKLKKVLIPNRDRYSELLKKLSTPENNIFDFINDQRSKLEYFSSIPQVENSRVNEKGSQWNKTQGEPLSS